MCIITCLKYTNGCPTLSAAYVCMFYLQNYWDRLHLWVRHLKCSLCWLAPPSESLAETLLIGNQPLVQRMFVSSSCRITEFHYTYGCATLSAAFICMFLLQNHRVTLHLWVSNLKCSLCLFALATESLGYTSVMGAPP